MSKCPGVHCPGCGAGGGAGTGLAVVAVVAVAAVLARPVIRAVDVVTRVAVETLRDAVIIAGCLFAALIVQAVARVTVRACQRRRVRLEGEVRAVRPVRVAGELPMRQRVTVRLGRDQYQEVRR